MSGIGETVFTICVTLIAVEVISRFCPENSMVGFVKALVSVMLLTAAISAVLNLNLDFSLSSEAAKDSQTELSQYVEGQVQSGVEAELKNSVEGILRAIDLVPEKTEIFTDISGESGIVLSKVCVTFQYDTDAQRAKVLLEQTLGDDVQVEVKTDGR